MKEKEKTFTASEITGIVYSVLDEEIEKITEDVELDSNQKFASNLFKMTLIGSIMKKLMEEE